MNDPPDLRHEHEHERALAALPLLPMEAAAASRLAREARAAYLRRFEGGPLYLPLLLASRVALPAALAAFTGLYMTWAIGTATALVSP